MSSDSVRSPSELQAGDGPAPGRPFRDYDILTLLGQKGVTRVYLGRDMALGGRLMVVKVSPLDVANDSALGLVAHPQIAAVTSCEYDGPSGLTVMASPFHGGVPLHGIMAEVVKAGVLPTGGAALLAAADKLAPQTTELVPTATSEAPPCQPPLATARSHSYVETVLDLADQLGRAMAHSHRNEIAHGALHPGNVLINSHGALQVTDFVRPTAPDSWPSPEYLPFIAPENLRDMLTADRTADGPFASTPDIYSWGVLVYFMLTGTVPYGDPPAGLSGEEAVRWQLAANCRPPRPLRASNPGIPVSLEQLVLRCCHPDPAMRYDSIEAVLTALRQLGSPFAKVIRSTVRYRKLVTTAAVALLLCVTGGLAWWGAPAWKSDTKYQAMAEAYRRGDYVHLRQLADETLERDPNDAYALLVRGAAFKWGPKAMDPKRQRFWEDVRRSVEIRPSADGYWLLANFSQFDKRDSAREFYRQAIALEPKNAALRQAFVAFLLSVNRQSRETVVGDADQAIACAPHDPVGYLLRGSAFRASALAKAREDWHTALRLSGTSAWVKLVALYALAENTPPPDEALVRQTLEDAVRLGAPASALTELPHAENWNQKAWWKPLYMQASQSLTDVNAKNFEVLHDRPPSNLSPPTTGSTLEARQDPHSFPIELR